MSHPQPVRRSGKHRPFDRPFGDHRPSGDPHPAPSRRFQLGGVRPTARRLACGLAALLVGATATWSLASPGVDTAQPTLQLPWAAAGLDERQAAAHALDRLAYGARPGEVDRVLALGLETWVATQIAGSLAEPDLPGVLADLDALRLSGEELARRYPHPGTVLRRARRQGGEMAEAAAMLAQDAQGAADDEAGTASTAERARARRAMRELFLEAGFRPPRELDAQLRAQRLWRAIHAENQLHEVLTDFWFNHFHVSVADPEARSQVLAYERDAIRPHITGSFRTLLGATARHPAMLLYLDNARSRAEAGRATDLALRHRDARRGRGRRSERGMRSRTDLSRLPSPPPGLNENYARELLELHTLGVEGGYREADVVEIARAFTGWTVLPPDARQRAGRRLPPNAVLERAGFRFDGLFVYDPRGHDAEAKTVLGVRLAAGRGLEDGEAVLDLLARHPSTAHHLATKLAVRFVADEPSAALVDRLAATFRKRHGDLSAVLVTLVESEEFWRSRGRKVKTPLELAASAVRALGAEVRDPRPLVDAIAAMGQDLYAYPAPTGVPDEADFWLQGGGLLKRLRFTQELAAGDIGGISLTASPLRRALADGDAEDALPSLATTLLPARDTGPLVARLHPHAPAEAGTEATRHFVGLILGSPEFQRR